MTDGRWRRIRELFSQIVDLPPGKREAALEARAADPGVREEVRSLLAAHDEAGSFLDDPPADVPRVLRRLADDPEEGEHVGAYRIVRLLGRGGMGSVFLAERADGTYRQTVALKLLPRALATGDLPRRFRSERQLLADLDHPNIARLLDGGETDDGRPYLVMEHVSGRRVDRYREEEGLDVRATVELFLPVCRAVAHAHRRLVVHRDLKPANILVTPEGVPKLLDFGIARILDEGRRSGDAAARDAADGALSPVYASPEQRRGDPVSTASDVYALGVLLHELLAGRPPPAAEDERGTGSDGPPGGGDPPAPSRVAPPDRRREIDPDLDAVVLRALEVDPSDRYESAARLVDDLERRLGHRPVEAREPSVPYRARKFVRRNLLGVAAAAAVLLALAGGLVAAGWQAREAARARDEARREARQAEEASDFLVGLFAAPDPTSSRPDTLTARTLLERGVARMEDELADDPASRARMLTVMGRAFENLGRTDTARALLESSVELKRDLFGPESLEAAESMSALAERLRGDRAFDEAEPLARKVLEIRRRELSDTAAAVTAALLGLGHTLDGLGRIDTAAVLVRRGLERRRKRFGPDHPETLTATTGLATVLREQGRRDTAEALYRGALPRFRALGPEHWPDLARALNNFAYLLQERGALGEAERAFRESLGLLRPHLGPGHPRTSLVMWNLASLLEKQGELGRAVQVLRARRRAVRGRWPEGHWRAARATQALGTFLVQDGRVEEGSGLLRRAVAAYERALGPAHPWTAATRSRHGAALAALERFDEAEAAARTALRQLVREEGPDARRTQRARERLVGVYEAWGRTGMAERVRAEAAAD